MKTQNAQFSVSIALKSLKDIGQHNERIGNVGISYSFWATSTKPRGEA